MARLLVIYDPTGRLQGDPETKERLGQKDAMIDLRDGLEGKDIYALAKKLAEMLLEQLA